MQIILNKVMEKHDEKLMRKEGGNSAFNSMRILVSKSSE